MTIPKSVSSSLEEETARSTMETESSSSSVRPLKVRPPKVETATDPKDPKRDIRRRELMSRHFRRFRNGTDHIHAKFWWLSQWVPGQLFERVGGLNPLEAFLIGELPRRSTDWSSFGSLNIVSLRTGLHFVTLTEVVMLTYLIFLTSAEQSLATQKHHSAMAVFVYQSYYIALLPALMSFVCTFLIGWVYRYSPDLNDYTITDENKGRNMGIRQLPEERPPARYQNANGLFIQPADRTLLAFQCFWALHYHLRWISCIAIFLWSIWWLGALKALSICIYKPSQTSTISMTRLFMVVVYVLSSNRLTLSLSAYRDVCACGGKGNEHTAARLLWVHNHVDADDGQAIGLIK